MKSLVNLLVVIVVFGSMYSCQKDSRPNYQFMPNMYEPVGYETYGEYEVFPGEQSAMLPVDGTIARGYELFEYDGTNEGYELAKAELKTMSFGSR